MRHRSGKPSTKAVKIPFEKTEITLELPEDWQVLDTVRPVNHAAISDVPAALARALDWTPAIPVRSVRRGTGGW